MRIPLSDATFPGFAAPMWGPFLWRSGCTKGGDTSPLDPPLAKGKEGSGEWGIGRIFKGLLKGMRRPPLSRQHTTVRRLAKNNSGINALMLYT